MVSVTSLDQDMRRLRLDRYTPKAANEARAWLEETLGERLPPGDLLEALKDGTALCRIANMALPPPGIKFKKSTMPFIQMENISHFLRACESPPMNMPAHDRFLTVDLYEAKDPAQVLQCLGAFSRVANQMFPHKFKSAMGPPKRGAAMSPVHTGASNGGAGFSGFGRNQGLNTASSGLSNSTAMPPPSSTRERALSPALSGGSNSSRGGMSSPPASSWSKKSDEGITAPAWNIHQYGYMGGASQGNQGIAFGARRQITSAAPHVPSLAEKERKRREKEADEERLAVLAEEADHKRRIEREAEEEQARLNEERRWEEESLRAREEEKRHVEKQKREWEDQERRWQVEEEARLKEEQELQDRLKQDAQRKRGNSDARLRGQYLSEYQFEEKKSRSRQSSYNDPVLQAERERVHDLEQQLEEAKERERQYQQEREERHRNDRGQRSKSRTRSKSRPRQQSRPPSPQERDVSWAGDERESLHQQKAASTQQGSRQRPLPVPTPTTPSSASTLPTRPLPEPSSTTAVSARPLPDPSSYTPIPKSKFSPNQNRTDRFLSSNPAPVVSNPKTHHPTEMGISSEAERAAEDNRRVQSQQKTKAGGWASKSLLEREMERERERQQEWELAQKAAQKAPRDASQGTGPGQSWDVNQYGFTGGDGQNKATAPGIGFGGRRQIIGPRPLGGPR